MQSAYVYAILVDGLTRYIGKGSGRRTRSHMKIVRSMARRRAAGEVVMAESVFYEKLCRAYLDGSEIEASIIVSGLTHEEAFRRESAEREKYPSYQLWNAGRCWDRPEYRQKQSARWSDPVLKEVHRKSVADSITQEEKSARSLRMKTAWAKSGSGGNLRRGQEIRRLREFDDTAAGKLLAAVRSAPDGLRFSDMVKMYPHLHPTSTLKRLADRGLIVKGPDKRSPWVATNIIEIRRA